VAELPKDQGSSGALGDQGRTEETLVETIRRRSSLVAVLTVALVTVGALHASPARADLNPKERQLRNLIYKARDSHDVRKLQVSGKLSQLARKHVAQMINHGNPVMHSSSSQMYGYMRQANCHASLGENVGMDYSVLEMHQAFMRSSGHRANILRSTWRKVGVGVKVHNGRVWVTELFCV
jgi:uncharacterized protein YkwD